MATTTRRRLSETPFWQTYLHSRYAILFYSLLLTLVIMPLATVVGLPQTVIRILLGLCLVAAIMPNATKQTRFRFGAFILLLAIAQFASSFDEVPVSERSVLGLLGAIGLVAAAGALRFVIRTKEVGSETLYAALSTYLLAGLFFGQIYWSIESAWPGSIAGPSPLTEASCVYFSFVTLGSLGYGDFLPKTDLARGVAIFEVIGGQLFLAVMVARLIGLFTDKERRS